MNQFVIEVPDSRDVPFVRALLLGLRQVSLVEEPELSEEEEAREQADAQAAYDRYKADPAPPEFVPWEEVKAAMRDGREC